MNDNRNRSNKGKKRSGGYKGRNNSDRRSRSTDNRSRRESADSAETTVSDINNDPKWYFANEGLMEQLSRFSFNQFVGTPIDMGDGNQLRNPSIAVIELYPTPTMSGKNIDSLPEVMKNDSGLNWATKKIYQAMSTYTGRPTTQYTPYDIGVMLLAEGEILSMVSFIRRAFGISMIYNMRNRDYPFSILKAMYIDPVDFRQNAGPYRARANLLLNTIGKIPMPANVSYFAKCASLYDNVYLDDGQSPFAQTIIPVPGLTWILDEEGVEEGSVLRTQRVCHPASNPTSSATLEDAVKPLSYYLDILEGQINALLSSSTMNVVYSDLLNYASKTGLSFLAVPLISEEYVIAPVYSENFLMQFHNAKVLGYPFDVYYAEANTLVADHDDWTNENDIYPADNLIDYAYMPLMYALGGKNSETFINETAAESYKTVFNHVLLDFATGDPSVGDRIDATRYSFATEFAESVTMKTGTTGDPSRIVRIYPTLGDHSVGEIRFHNFLSGNFAGMAALNKPYLKADVLSATNVALVCSFIEKFDWAPTYYATNLDQKTSKFTVTAILGDLNYYTTVDPTYLHNVNVLSEQGLFDFRSNISAVNMQ